MFVERVVEIFPTSTRVAKVMTDKGVAFLKGMGNPSGLEALASELVAGELAAWLGLRVAPFAVINLDLDVPMKGHGFMERGPAFVSQEIKGGVGDPGATFLAHLRRPGDLALLVLFDTWVRNADRWPPDGAEDGANRDNLFFAKVGSEYDVVALDHSHCFIEGDWDGGMRDPFAREDSRVFGRFPEFLGFIGEASVLQARARLSEMSHPIAAEIVDSVPTAWGPASSTRRAWAEFINHRAHLVAAIAPERLTGSAHLDLS